MCAPIQLLWPLRAAGMGPEAEEENECVISIVFRYEFDVVLLLHQRLRFNIFYKHTRTMDIRKTQVAAPQMLLVW